jgi:hypothetical protein
MLKERRAQGEIINSIEYPDVCIQGSTGGSNFGGTGTEDCLKVNVYAPANATSSSKCEHSLSMCENHPLTIPDVH